MNLKKVIQLFILLLSFAGLQAQVQNVPQLSTVTETIGGIEFYLHRVESGQTLFAISKLYGVEISEILQSNPEIDENIRQGEILKVPVSGELHPSQEPIPMGMNLRRVAKGETLYSLAKEYKVTEEEILKANDGLPAGLQEGTFIKIPIFDRTQTQVTGQPVIAPSENQPSKQLPVVSKTPPTGSSQQPSEKPQHQPEEKNFEFQGRNNESLYELAIRYRVSIDSILALNPGVDEQLSKGQIIRIPVISVDRNYITHNVRQQMTLNRLARNYNIAPDQIMSINPYVSRQLQPGQTIKIPLPAAKITEVEDDDVPILTEDLMIKDLKPEVSKSDFCKQLNENGVYNIALMIPLFLDKVQTSAYAEDENDQDNNTQEFIKPFLFLQYYEGLLLALDSLKQLGFNADLHVFNVEDDVNQAQNVLKNLQNKDIHLIIGPFYNTSFRIVAEFARENNILIVNPLSTRNEFLSGNPFAFKINPAEDQVFQTVADFLNQKHASSQLFIARHNATRDDIKINELKSVFDQHLNRGSDIMEAPYQEIIFTRDSLRTFKMNASTTKENVVLIFSDNKLFILDMMRKLNLLREQYDITVIGLPDWLEIEGLDYPHMNNLNTHLVTDGYVDYDSDLVRNFVRKFRSTYHADPEKYAFKGFDAGIFFFSALMKYGPHANDCIPHHDRRLLYNSLRFKATSGNGFENQDWKVLHISNFRLNEVYFRRSE